MYFYLWLKYIHILSSTILFGTGLGTAFVLLYGHFSRNMATMAVMDRYVVHVDWFFTGLSGLVQLLSGLGMVYLAGYSLKTFWILGGLIGYFITFACWLPVVFLQIKLKNITTRALENNTPLPVDYYKTYMWWFFLGWPAFISLLIVFYLMIFKPTAMNL